MADYIHELSDWPKFHWDEGRLAAPLAAARHLQGRLVGQMEALGFRLREEAVLRILTDDVVKSSEIEGEKLDADQVRSSVARRLGLDVGGLQPADRERAQHRWAPSVGDRLRREPTPHPSPRGRT